VGMVHAANEGICPWFPRRFRHSVDLYVNLNSRIYLLDTDVHLPLIHYLMYSFAVDVRVGR
jgi:hypothetical protein